MKLSALTAIVAGAAIAQVSAAPLRVIMVSSSSQELPSNLRFGHAVEHPPAVAQIMAPARPGMRGPCGRGRMNRFRQKSVEISNAFRQALGWPLIETHAHAHAHAAPPSGPLRILPINPGEIQFLRPNEPIPEHHDGLQRHHGLMPPPPRGHRFSRPRHDSDFLNRLHYSLMNLGLWEGRAVAFVLGCGIGVLLRMFWVLAVVAFRAVRPRSSDEPEDEYTHIVMFDEAEVTPPQYTYPVDEKVAVEEVHRPADAAESK